MPIILKLKSGKPVLRGADHYWSIARELGKDGAEFTVSDLVGWSNGSNRKTIGDFVRRLCQSGYARAAGWRTEDGRKHRTYTLLKRPADTPILGRNTANKQGRGVQQMWNAIRALDSFAATELALAASVEDVRVSRETAKTYLRRLEESGYLIVRVKGGPWHQRIYSLKPSMNTGPKAPKILRAKIVYDPNRNQVVGDVVAEEGRS